MSYQILTEQMGLPFCVLNGVAGVGQSVADREKFFRILQKSNVDYYQCPYARYLVIGKKHDILLNSLKDVKGRGESYICTSEGEVIYLNRQTFSIRCIRKDCISPEPWVKEYIPKPKKEKNQKKGGADEPQFKLVEIGGKKEGC